MSSSSFPTADSSSRRNFLVLIYDHSRGQMTSGQTPNLPALNSAAVIIRSFVEDYHEKQLGIYQLDQFTPAQA